MTSPSPASPTTATGPEPGRGRLDALPWTLLLVAVYAAGAHLFLLARLPVPMVWAPVALVVALLLGRPRRPPSPGVLVIMVVLLCLLPGVAGALATRERDWDGLTAWGLTARFLAEGRGLEHPFFADPAVYNYTRSYPLLQPLLAAGAMDWVGARVARLLSPAIYLLLLGAVGWTLSRATVGRIGRRLTLLAVALMPAFTGIGHAALDSGFADPLLCALLTAAGGALLVDAPLVAGLAAFLLPLTKVEGTALALLVAVVGLLTGHRRAGLAAAAGAGASLVVWLPLMLRLVDPAAGTAANCAAAASGLLLAAAAVVIGAALAPGVRRLWMVPVGLGIAVASVVLLPALLPEQSLLAVVAREMLDVDPRGGLQVLGAFARQPFVLRRFGTALLVLPFAVLLARKTAGGSKASPTLVLLVCYVALLIGFMLSRPPDRLALFLREGLPRYLVQVVGLVWLEIAHRTERVRSATSA